MERVHRLVAGAFIPNPNVRPEVNHKDGNKAHVCARNLEWSTHAENVEHAVANGLTNRSQAGKFGELNPNARLTNTDAAAIRQAHAAGASKRRLAGEYRVSRLTIAQIVSGVRYRTS